MGQVLDFSNYAGDNWGLPVETQSTDYSVAPLSDGVPDNFVNVPQSEGITWGGALGGLQKTAQTLFDTFGKVYTLNSQIESQNFQRKVQSTQLEIAQAQTAGTLQVEKAKIDANTQIELARAGRAVNDAIAATKSGSAGFMNPSRMSPMLLAALAIGAGYFFMRGKK